MSRQRLDQVDAAKADLEAIEVVYNRALDELEVRVCGGNLVGRWSNLRPQNHIPKHLSSPHPRLLVGGSEGSLLPLPQAEGRTQLADGPCC